MSVKHRPIIALFLGQCQVLFANSQIPECAFLSFIGSRFLWLRFNSLLQPLKDCVKSGRMAVHLALDAGIQRYCA